MGLNLKNMTKMNSNFSNLDKLDPDWTQIDAKLDLNQT